MGLLLTYLFVALSISFLCSLAEAAILSVPISYIKAKQDKGSKAANRLAKMKEEVDKPLSAILSLNTIAHTIGAAGVGAQATALWGEAYFGIVSAVLTILILVTSEILPKSIGTRYCRAVILPVANVLHVLIYLLYPIVWCSKGITVLVAANNQPQEKVSREEIAALTEIGEEEGIFAANESKTIRNLIRSRSLKALDVMTPRTVMVTLDERMTLMQFVTSPEVVRHSRFPVFSDDPDNVTGYIHKYDVIDNINKGKRNISLSTIKRQVVICYENISVPKLFDTLLEKKEHIAILVDEYGGVSGLVSLEDIIETIFGFEIIDERDSQADMQQLAKDQWRLRAKKLNNEDLKGKNSR